MMTFDRVKLSSVLKYICGVDERLCRLCLGLVEDKAVSFEDSVEIKTAYYEGTMTYQDMFEELHVSTDPFLPSKLCNSCVTVLTNTYLFGKLCEFSTKTWVDVLERLDRSFDPNDTVALGSSVRAMYLLIQETNDIRFFSRKDHSKLKEKEVAINIKKMLKQRDTYERNKKDMQNGVKCKDCAKTFTSILKLSKHRLGVHKKSNCTCIQCHRVFSTPLLLQDHLEKYHYPKKIKCPKCDMMFSTQKVLTNHDKNYHIPVHCKLCSNQFPSKVALRFHMNRHDIYKCNKCSKILKNKQSYQSHLKMCGNLEDKSPKFFCDICGKGYVRKNGIRSHLKICHGFGNVLSCKWCGKKFDAISKMRNHVVKHTRERNFHCDHCGNRFVTHAALIYHVRLHTGEKPFPCDMCDESFLSASRRMEHKRRKHFGPTKQCPVCPMKFTGGTQLKKHVQRHNNPHSKLYCPTPDEAQGLAVNAIMVL